jgi:CheY-like chemotaxis protein
MAKILIVEDYESLQYIYATVLKEEGHQVDVVNDGMVALEKTEATDYDLILLDLLLPHMSGMEFLHKYDPKRHPKTKVIICSNFTNPKFIQEANELGVSHHLTKSNLSPKEVIAIVDKTLKEP